MGLKDLALNEEVHVRTMTIRTFPAKDACILVEGELIDDRKIEVYTVMAEKRPRGPFHNMIIRMLIGPPGLTLRDIEVEMPLHPYKHCPDVVPRFDMLKGLAIQSGFTATLKRTIGGISGCAHITSLLTAMASAAIQGFFTVSASNPHYEASKETRLKLVSFISDTCHVWKKDGPHITQILDKIKNSA